MRVVKGLDVACSKRQVTCFAYHDGMCSCLVDTKFGRRECPFYKDKEVFRDGLKRYPFTRLGSK